MNPAGTATGTATTPAPEEQVLAVARRAFQLARAADEPGLRALLDAGLPPDLCNERGDSLLMLASYHGGLGATRLLIERGADPNRLNDRGQTPLAGVAFKGDLAMAGLLLNRGRAPVDGCGPDGKTALMFAAMFDRVEMLDLLLAHGADRDRRDAGGNSALTLARGMGAQQAAARLRAG